MNHRKLADIQNPQTRIAEFEFRLRTGSLQERRRAILEAIADPYPPLRHQAGSAAADLDDEALDPLLCALAVGDAAAAVHASVTMGLAPDDAPAPLAPVRQVACLGLRASLSPCALPSLVRAGGDDDPDVRYQALVALHELDARGDAFADLIAQRLSDPDPEVTVVAAQIASQRGWVDLAGLMVERWRAFGGSDKFQLALCLGELVAEHEWAREPSFDPAVLVAITEQFLDALKNEVTATSAIMALQRLRVERAREPLERLVSGWFGHPLIKVEAAGALYLLGSEVGEKYLSKSLKSSRKDARGYALRLVGRLHIEPFFDTLKNVARSPEYHADTAVLALADYGGEEARGVLADVALNHTDHEVRSLAGRALESKFSEA